MPCWEFSCRPPTPGCRSSVSLKGPVLIAVLSIACIVLLFSISEYSSSGESCLILIVDESQDDSLIRETLASGGLADFISESSQLVAVDDFGSLKFIPLDSFRNEIEEFDPRDDGYARKMCSFFVHEGKRFFFRLFDGESGIRIEKIKKEANSLLENIPRTFMVIGPRGHNFWYIVPRYTVLVIAASFLALLVSRYRRLFIFQIPALLLFVPCGFYSLILAAILSSVWELLREPLEELSAAFHYKRRFRDYAGSGLRGVVERLKPFRVNLALVLAFVLFLAAFSFFGVISPFFLAVVFVLFSFLYFISLKVEAEQARKNRHVLFTPVLMLPQKVKTFSFFPLLMPFALMSLFALFMPQAELKWDSNPVDPGHFIRAEEYERHIAFQYSFSYRSMNQEDDGFQALNKTEYLRYYLGEDGLIAGSYSSRDEAETHLFREAPPFPLEKLMDFLIKYSIPAVGGDGTVDKTIEYQDELSGSSAVNKIKEFVSVAIIAAVCLLDFLRTLIAPKKSIPITGDKRIAA